MTNSPIPRVGGKRLLRKTICDSFPPAKNFDRYIEVFGGAAWVLLYKDKHAQLEVYNDADGNLINFMRCIKYHSGELRREIDGFYNSREMLKDCFYCLITTILLYGNCTRISILNRLKEIIT